MNEIMAVKPNGGTVVHLAQLGYQPGKKRRSIRDDCSLCNVGVPRQERVPLSEALRWPNPDNGSAIRPGLPWSWCRPCIGHAAAIAGLGSAVLVQVAAAVGS
jgi:hypothetical protein